MAKTADIGSKRLISLAPETWARWLTGDLTVDVLDFPSGEFEWVGQSGLGAELDDVVAVRAGSERRR